MKKCISVLLALLISILIFPYSEKAVFAQEKEIIDIDIFKAQCMAGIAEDNHSNAVAQCNNLYNYYVNENIYSPTQTFLDTMYANKSLMALYETWQIYNLEKTASAALQRVVNIEDYYESLIIGMFQKALLQQNDLKEIFNNKILNDSKSMTSVLCEITSATDAAELSGMMGLKDPETYEKVTKTVENKYPSGIASKIIGNISLIFEISKNVVDALDRISVYASMAELDESAKLWLQQLYDACGSDFPVELKNAVSNLKKASMGFADAALVSIQENTFSIATWAFDSALNSGLQAAAALNPVTNAVMIGLVASKTICNIFFGSDDIYEQLYVMECIYEVQDLSRRVVENCKNSFINNQTKENAMAFNYAVDCYYESIINIDIDCMKSFLYKLYNGGIDLGSAGGAMDLVISWVYGTPDDYDDAVDSLESLRSTRITNKQNLEAYVWIALMANHPETYDYYFPDKDMVPVTSLSLLVTYILPEGYEHETNKTKIVEGDDATYWVDYSPEEADLTDYTITVSDPEILQVKDGVILALKPGTATVTATSTADDHIFDTEEIEVIERIEASEEEDDDESASIKFTYTISNNEITITGLADGYEPTELVIPSTIEGYPVTRIEGSAFRACDSLTEVTIGDSVTSIGGWAFSGCDSLTEVTIGDSVTSIGAWAFSSCDSLTDVAIGNGVTSIEEYAFSYCDCLTNVYYLGSVTDWCKISFGYNSFPNLVADNFYILGDLEFTEEIVRIPDYRFENCKSLTEITIPDSVTSIENSAFSNCESLTNVTIEYGVASIGEDAFSGCYSLTEITIPNSVTSIGAWAFSGCNSLTDVYYLGSVTDWCKKPLEEINSFPHLSADNFYILGDLEFTEEIDSIPDRAFENCKNLTEITIPDSVTSIGNHVFSNCDSLTEVTIPDSVKSIGEYAFSNCDSLTEITIPDSVTSIGSNAFSNCDCLTEVAIGNGVKSIGDSAFQACDSLKEITIPDSVTSIGDSAFSNCDSLTEITIPDSVTSIESNAFYDCDSLTEITIPDSVTSIGWYAFYDCDSLTEITIPGSVTSIGDWAFYGCDSLTEVAIGNGVTSIGNHTFNSCDSLTDVYYLGSVTDWCKKPLEEINSFPHLSADNFYILGDLEFTEEIDSIPDRAFENCKNLTEITIPDSVTSIGNHVFSNCDSLTEVTIPDSVKSIGEYAFSNCDSLTEITIPDSVTSIGSNAFSNCDSLTNVTIGATSIWNYAFYDCDSLTDVAIGNGVKSIGDSAFQACDSLTEITIPDSVTSIGDSAFSDCASLTDVYYLGSVTDWCKMSFDGASLLPNYYADNFYILGDLEFTEEIDRIPDYAFENCKSLTEITIPDSVTSIGAWAFSNCDSLTNVTIGATSIGNYAFYDCDSLTNVTMGNSVTSIGNWAFCHCESLANVIIGSGVTSIGYSAFYDCDSLTEITIPDSVTSIGQYAFAYCGSLTNVILGNGIISIGFDAFYYCDSLTDVYYLGSVTDWCKKPLEEINSFPHLSADNFYILGDLEFTEEIDRIPDYAFENCKSLTEVTIPDSVKSIGDSAFSNCENLTNVTIGNSVASIGDGAFTYCDSLTEITIPDSVTSIGDFVFSDCGSLTSVTIPDSVTSIGYYLFPNCDNLANVYYLGSVTDWCKISFDGASLLPNYYADNFYILGDLEFTEEIDRIPDYAFENCKSLTEVTISDSVKSIGDSAFTNCENLTNVAIGNGVASIGDGAFYNCDSLTNVTIGNSVTSIGDWAFCDCESLANVIIGSGVTSIGYSAFYDCDILTEITIPDSVTSIGDSAFLYCVLSDVYYNSSQEHWQQIEIGSDNEELANATIHYNADENHKYELVETVEATCVSDGYSIYKCPCNYERRIDIQATGHKKSEIIETVSATCTDDGYTVYRCSVCGEEYEDDWVYCEGHKKGELIKTVPPTCTDDGYTVYRCSVCEEEYEDDWVNCEGHQKGEIIETVPATCTDDGYTVYRCSVCEEEYEDDWVYCEGHKKGEIIETVPATCTDDGYTLYRCSVCGEEYEDDWVNCEGHQKGEIIETVPATCTSDGYTVYRCSVCGEEFEADWTWVDHSYEIKILEQSATCVERGYIEYKCATCDDTYIEYTEDALGHMFENNVCTRCGMLKEDCIESEHPYLNNMDKTYTLHKDGAQSISITFSNDTYVEGEYDYIYIYDKNDNLIGIYTGDDLSSKELLIPGDTVKIQITSDESNTEYGFSLVKVETNNISTDFAYLVLDDSNVMITKYTGNDNIIAIPTQIDGYNVASIDDYAFDNNDGFTDVYYSGTEEEWNNIVIGEGNDILLNATIHFVSTAEKPDAPTGFDVTGTGNQGTLLYLDWEDSANADGYRMYVISGDKEYYKGEVTDSMFKFTDLTAGWNYSLRIEAFNSAGTASTETTICAAPASMTADDITLSTSGSKLNISWEKQTCTGYVLQWSTDSSFKNMTGTKYIDKPWNTSYSVNIADPQNYYVRVRAYKTYNGMTSYGDFSPAVKEKVLPGTITGFDIIGTGNKGSLLYLDWNGMANTDGYKVYVVSGEKEYLKGTTTDSQFKFTDLTPGWNYTVKVVAYNADGETATTTTICAAPATMTTDDFAAKASVNKLNISWDKQTCTGYVVQWSTDSSFKNVTGTKYIDKPWNTSYSVSISNPQNYYVRVRAYKTYNGMTAYGDFSPAEKAVK